VRRRPPGRLTGVRVPPGTTWWRRLRSDTEVFGAVGSTVGGRDGALGSTVGGRDGAVGTVPRTRMRRCLALGGRGATDPCRLIGTTT
jgi:hypothetical protein